MRFNAITRENIPDSCFERFLPSDSKGIAILESSNIQLGGMSILKRGFYAERARARDYHILNITVKGSGRYEMEDGEVFTVGPGEMFISTADSLGHKHYPEMDDWELIWFQIGKEAAWFTPLEERFILKRCNHLKEIYNTMDLLIKESLSDEDGSLRLQQTFAESLLIYLKREISEQLSPETDEIRYRINKLWNQVNSHLPGKWSVEEMARIVGLSRSHFFRQCMKIYGITPGEKVKSLKMIRAKQMLINLDSPIYIISESVGYENPNAFISAFKVYYGESPKRYKRSVLGR